MISPRRVLVRAAHTFVDANCRISSFESRVAAKLTSRRSGRTEFLNQILPSKLKPGLRVLDVGGGKFPAIDVETKTKLGLYVAGLDVSPSELARAPAGAYDEIIVGDVAAVKIPGDFDLIFSVTLLEHVRNTSAAIANLAGALKPGGAMAHFQPCRYAGFAVINRLLGNRWAKRVLYSVYPRARQTAGFPAYYNQCVPKRMARICQDHGLDVITLTPYFASNYFHFFAPFHTLELLRQTLLRSLSASTFAETFTFVAEKSVQRAQTSQRTAA